MLVYTEQQPFPQGHLKKKKNIYYIYFNHVSSYTIVWQNLVWTPLYLAAAAAAAFCSFTYMTQDKSGIVDGWIHFFNRSWEDKNVSYTIKFQILKLCNIVFYKIILHTFNHYRCIQQTAYFLCFYE